VYTDQSGFWSSIKFLNSGIKPGEQELIPGRWKGNLTMISIARFLTRFAAAVILIAPPANAVTAIFAWFGRCATITTGGGNPPTTQVTVGPCALGNGLYGPFDQAASGLSNSTQTSVVSQFVDGGGWQTTLVITNTTASKVTASLSFYRETAAGDGSTQPWNPTFREGSATQNLSLAGGATLFLHTPGTASALTQGWGQATVSDGVQIYAVFSRTGGGQGTAPAATIGNHIMLPYDNTPGNVTAIALANPTSTSETVSVSFQSASGAISRSSVTIPSQGHLAFLLPAQFAATAADHGLAEFYTATGSISLTGLQSGPGNFFTTAQAYFKPWPPIIGNPDPEGCWINPFFPPCFPPFLLTTFPATISSSPIQVVVTPDSGGTYSAAVSGTVNGATVSGSFVGGTITNLATNPSPLTLSFTSVSPGSTFSSGSLNFALAAGTAFDAATGEAVGNVTGSITLNQANVGSGTINGAYTEIISLQSSVPAPALTFALQSRSPGTGNLSMAVSNTGGAAATNVTITSIAGITASGATFVYVPGLLNPPFVVPGAANLAPGASSGFNLNFQATSGSAGTPFSFVITAKADNVAPFTMTINVP
jgi:hypothetical protein